MVALALASRFSGLKLEAAGAGCCAAAVCCYPSAVDVVGLASTAAAY